MTITAEFDFERYPSNWGQKIALVFESEDDHDRLVNRMKKFEWDDVHNSWTPDYEWVTVDRDDGAWTIDCTRLVVDELRNRSIPVPPLDDIPIAIETVPFPCGAVTRKCPKCHEMSIINATGARDVYPQSDSDRIAVLVDDALPATHLCLRSDCGQYYEHHGDMTARLTPKEATQSTDPEPADSLIKEAFGT